MRTGWHTNRYVKCRDLCSNAAFVRSLCQQLAAVYLDRGFTKVLAIGTSAIRVGAVLSHVLGTRFSYTFMGRGDAAAREPGAGTEYTKYELDFKVREEEKVLVIDDVLAVGGTMRVVTNKLKSMGVSAENMHVFTLYKLGDRPDVGKQLAGIRCDYLAEFPDVQYFEEDPKTGKCEACRNRPDAMVVEE